MTWHESAVAIHDFEQLSQAKKAPYRSLFLRTSERS